MSNNLFYSELVGSHFEAPHFQQVDALFAPPPKLTKSIILFRSCWVIQILLGPVLNFERRNPTDFDPVLSLSLDRIVYVLNTSCMYTFTRIL